MQRLNEGRVEGFPASPPTPPPLTRVGERAALRREVRYDAAEGVERRRQLRGLLLLAVLILVGSILRAGAENVFTRGWWRLW